MFPPIDPLCVHRILGTTPNLVEDFCPEKSCNTLGIGEYTCRDLMLKMWPFAEGYACGTISAEEMMIGFNEVEAAIPGVEVTYSAKDAYDLWMNDTFLGVWVSDFENNSTEHRALVAQALNWNLFWTRLNCEYCQYCQP